MRRAAVVLASIAAAAVVGFGCTIWNDAELLEPGLSGSSSSSSGSTSSGSLEGGCARETIDTANPGAAAGTGGDIEILVAVRSINLGIDAEKKVRADFGYDLDGVCGDSCVARSPDGGIPDGELGRDIGTANAVAGLGIDPGEIANESFAAGSIGILARITGYNGQPNDDVVRFSLYRSTGVTDGKPSFDGPAQDWKIDTADLATTAGDDYASTNESPGFVRAGILIVDGLESSKIPFNNDSDIRLRNVTFTAEIVEVNGRWTARKALGVGRWDLKDALQTIAFVRDPLKKDGDDRLCQNPLLFNRARDILCARADIALKPGDDGKGVTCDALSTAVEFETVPARFGPKETPARLAPCQGITIPGCD